VLQRQLKRFLPRVRAEDLDAFALEQRRQGQQVFRMVVDQQALDGRLGDGREKAVYPWS